MKSIRSTVSSTYQIAQRTTGALHEEQMEYPLRATEERVGVAVIGLRQRPQAVYIVVSSWGREVSEGRRVKRTSVLR